MHNNCVIRPLAKQPGKICTFNFISVEKKKITLRTKEICNSHGSSRCRKSNYESFNLRSGLMETSRIDLLGAFKKRHPEATSRTKR